MLPILFIAFTLFLITIIYTYAIEKIISNKFILFLPTGVSILWYLWQLLGNGSAPSQGFEDLSLFFTTFFIIIFTNISFGIYFLNRKKHSRRKENR